MKSQEQAVTEERELREVMTRSGGREFSAPRGSSGRGKLEFARGAFRVTIGSARIPDLFRAEFHRPIPSVSVDAETVTVWYPLFSPGTWLRRWEPRGGQVTLSEDVAWNVKVRRGVAHLDADLRGLRLEGVDLGQGASRLDVQLPRPSGVVPLRVGGGASHVAIRHPVGVPVRLRIGGGVADLAFYEQEFGAVGGRLRLESPEAASAEDRYEIEILGGAAHVRVKTE